MSQLGHISYAVAHFGAALEMSKTAALCLVHLGKSAECDQWTQQIAGESARVYQRLIAFFGAAFAE